MTNENMQQPEGEEEYTGLIQSYPTTPAQGNTQNTQNPYNATYSTTPMPSVPTTPTTPAVPTYPAQNQYAQNQYAQQGVPQYTAAAYGTQPTQPIQSAQTQVAYTAQPQTPTQPTPAQQGSAAPGGPSYTAPDTSAAAMNAAQAKARNAFADPANAYGTQASVTASGVAANAETVSTLIKKNRATTIWAAAGAAAVAALLVAGLGFAGIRTGIISIPAQSTLSSIESSTGGTGTASSSASNVNWTAVAKKVASSVVSIQGTVQNGTVIGSGAILDKDGHIITNNHVVSGASDLQVTLSDGSMYKAKVVGTDPTTDLAVIQLENAPSDLTPVSFADSDKLAVGESVMAIGSPLGYENTATTGIVSAVDRPVSVSSEDNSGNVVVTNAIQIDASINSGNSGGPTFNAEGKLVGINSSIATAGSSSSSEGSSGSIGIGFAIPANLAKWVSSAIIKDGKATHVSLGVTVKSATATADGVTRSGSQVQSVVQGSAAEAAGIQKGDTIVAYDKHTVVSNSALLGYVRATQLGEKVTLTVIRDGKTLDLTATMNKEETSTASSNSNGNSQNQQNNQNRNNQNQNNGGDDDNFTNPFEQFFGDGQ
ncbi:S1C family serine protease [Alloscardovia omnicolens]|uniref:S1C family serine protease n=1 Tax=Alloscardovia omnicolens TaxID=419015 RepID=UPI00069DC205|nr:trypsin-like peptidase domain-containing protein [Alloscardovia omnicolens]MDK6522268.1 trypsin-like peptidase domain-containing protein [Alloscardovia omnicolens]